MSALLEVSGVSKTFDGFRAINGGNSSPRIGDVKIINGNPMEYAGNGTGWIRIYA